MPVNKQWHQDQIDAYAGERPAYQTYAATLQQVLQAACDIHAHGAIVQARAKVLTSFAEKAIRKTREYPDPVHDFTDLCGGRVITSTQAQADRICDFILAHFTIVEEEDLRLRLGSAEFGYLSVHYIVQMPSEPVLGIPIPGAIGARRAEVQVRTLLQHTWAELVHDRVYKSAFKAPERWLRECARLAAQVEDLDGAFARLATSIDAYAGNYGVYMSTEQIREEIETLNTILAHEVDPVNRPGIALRIGRLARAAGDWEAVIDCLTPFADLEGHRRPEVLLALGSALCRAHREAPSHGDYIKGQMYLEAAARPADRTLSPDAEPDRVRAEALAHLAWSRGVGAYRETEVRDLYHLAFLCDPSNPYHLGAFLDYEVYCRREADFVMSMRPMVQAAIRTCRGHADVGIELPGAFFTMGRLHLLLGQPHDSLAAYAKALCLCRAEGVTGDAIAGELAFLQRSEQALKTRPEWTWVRQLLLLGQAACSEDSDARLELQAMACRKEGFNTPVVLVAGGTDSRVASKVQAYQNHLDAAFGGFTGTVISGGTTAGIAGMVGAAAEARGSKDSGVWKAIGYVPRLIPAHATRDGRYDALVETSGTDFSVQEPLQYWVDLIAAGVRPADVTLLGINGGRIAAVEFRLALALGARVGVLDESGRAVADLQADPDWQHADGLLVLPSDPMTVRAFVHQDTMPIEGDALCRAARAVHAKYLEDNKHARLDPSMLPWEQLADSLKDANRHQAVYAAQILRQVGYGVRVAQGEIVFPTFTEEEVERMAEMEHGRWNVDKLNDGFKPGDERDQERKTSPYLVPWKVLPEPVGEWDRDAVRNYPVMLKEAGLEVYRLE